MNITTLRNHLYAFASFLKFHLLRLNLFKSGNESELIIRNERRSTRLYLILLITAIIITGSYYSLLLYENTIKKESPSFQEYLNLPKEFSLKCPCKTIAISYKNFVDIKPDYHELCQNESDLISDKFIDQLYNFYELFSNDSSSSDFYQTAAFQFRTLRELCQTAQNTTGHHIKRFEATDFIQSQLITEESFLDQINSSLEVFIDLIPKDFLRTIKFIQDITAQSLFMTGASLTSILPVVQLYHGINDESIGYSGKNYTLANGFSCICSSSTATKCMGLTTFKNNTVHGFQTGCYMLSALLSSTLEVFYNQTFINIVTNSTNIYQKLNSSNSNLNSTIETLLSRMFVIHWSSKISFEQYFNYCSPSSCQYTVIQRHHILFIFIAIIGLFGGLSSTLRILVPIIIKTIWPFLRKFIIKLRTPTTQIISNESPENPTLSFNDRVKRFCQLIKQKLIELNLFKNRISSQDEHILRQQRYTTRIYLILLSLALIILILLITLQPQTIHIIEKSPNLTDFDRLYHQYPLTLRCSCQNTTIEKKLITNIKPEYHEVCTSDFISSEWINLQFLQLSSSLLITRDIRYQSQFHFQLLSTLCSIANQTIQDSLQSFYRTKLITNHVLPREIFQTQMNSTIEEFKRNVLETFQRILNLLRLNFDINQFITPMNSFFTAPDNIDENYNVFKFLFFYYLRKERDDCNSVLYGACYCISLSTYECYRETMINESGISSIIPGMFQTWNPLEALLISTLECFYQDQCLSQITKFINLTQISNKKFTKLSSNKTQYKRIDKIVNNLFIQSWNNESLFDSYFKHCHPLECQYSYKTRLNFIYTITTILGLIGGINTVLRLLLPILVKSIFSISNFVFRRRHQNVIRTRQTISLRIRFSNGLYTLFIRRKQKLKELNLFPTIPPSQDLRIIRRNRRSTRIYLILVITTLFILIIYTFIKQRTITDTAESPSLLKYKELYNQYSIKLECSCTNIAIKYKKFITEIKPEYHQICSSIFISPEWMESMPDTGRENILFDFEFQIHARIGFHFDSLSKICELTRNTLNTALSKFEETDFITMHVIPQDEFNRKIKSIIEQFKTTTSDQFIETFKLIQTINHANQLASLFSSSWRFYLSNTELYSLDQGSTLNVIARSVIYGKDNCSCGRYSTCSESVYFPFRTSNQSLRESLPGFFSGCLPFDSLLQSSLTCLYNQTCMDILRAIIYHSKPIPYNILTSSLLSNPNTTIETLLSQLFISQWFPKPSFNLYFNECNPQSCQYSYQMQYNSIYVATTLFALFGGLTKGLHFGVFLIGLIIYKIIDYRKKKTQIGIDSNQSDIAVIPDQIITTVQINVSSTEEQINLRNRRCDRILIISLILFAICTIITSTVILFLNRDIEENFIVTNTQTTLISSSSSSDVITEFTSVSPDICYLTWKYQSEFYATGLDPTSLITSDFNQDSINDLAVTNSDSDTISVFLGNGNGTFRTSKIYSTGNKSKPRDLKSADFNNDGLLDLVVTLYETKEIMIFFGVKSNDLFEIPPYRFSNNAFGYRPELIEVNDLNNDKFIDLLIVYNVNNAKLGGKLDIFFNSNNGKSFDTVADCNIYLQTKENITSIVIDDVNNNGKANDLIICGDYSRIHTFLKQNNTNQSEYCYDVIVGKYMYRSPSAFIKGRFNDDERYDLAGISFQSDTLQVLLDYGNNKFTQQIYLTETRPTSVAQLNFDNDSIDDLAVLTCNGTINIFVGRKFGIFRRTNIYYRINGNNSDKCCHSLKAVDLNQDGKDDLVFIDARINRIQILLSSNCDQ
ncbi:unnamed protein product [Adineta steineri]|uniref:Uncharacterized protein n=1 Tax=Adineta steineri TaxID=433720 RepID=A0A813PYD9_9BILA|nr:unnamed protein product [Adineta steineri]CAF3855782.1 unnamed protein product [Adineta steineri]